MQRFSVFELDELKLVYRVLHRNLLNEEALMDAEFVHSLQTWLQYRAGEDGVDLAHHAAWEAWLNGQPAPAPAGGRVIQLDEGFKRE